MLTAALAWIAFRKDAGRRIVVGMGLIVAGGIAGTVLPRAMVTGVDPEVQRAQ